LATAEHHAPRHLLSAEAHLGMHARHDEIELGEHFVGEVERAVLEDVDLHSGEDAERRQLWLTRGLRADRAALLIEAVRDGERAGWSVSTVP
jgi:hypothetical protein